VEQLNISAPLGGAIGEPVAPLAGIATFELFDRLLPTCRQVPTANVFPFYARRIVSKQSAVESRVVRCTPIQEG